MKFTKQKGGTSCTTLNFVVLKCHSDRIPLYRKKKDIKSAWWGLTQHINIRAWHPIESFIQGCLEVVCCWYPCTSSTLMFAESLIYVRAQDKAWSQCYNLLCLLISLGGHQPLCMENFVHLLVVVLLVWFSSAVSHDISSWQTIINMGYHNTRWFASWRWNKFGECNIVP